MQWIGMNTGLQPSFSAIRIIWDVNCLKTTNERLFPESRHRSKRVRKKLIKRFGGEFRRVPAIFKTPYGFIAHPNFKDRLERGLGK